MGKKLSATCMPREG